LSNNNINKIYKALEQFNKANLGVFPTPIHRLENFQKKINHNNIWIKRDDLTGLGMGGNKVRTLEYLLGDALLKNSDTILVSGPLQSNMCSIAAAASRKIGLSCITVHNSNTPKELKGNVTLLSLLNAKSYFIGETDEDERQQFVEKIATELKKIGKKPYIILKGGSTALGALGYVQAAVELYEQIKKLKLNIKHVFMPAGHGGTVAGLIVGAGLLDIPFHVHVISVEHPKHELVKIINNLIKEIEELLDLKITYPIDQVMTIYDDYMGEGWGKPTKESDSMIYEFPQLEGIFVEKVYTSKVVVGMVDLLQKQVIPSDDGACYWHTGGLPSLFAQV